MRAVFEGAVQVGTADAYLAGQLFHFDRIAVIMIQIRCGLAKIKFLACQGAAALCIIGRRQPCELRESIRLLVHTGKQQKEIPDDFQGISFFVLEAGLKQGGHGKETVCGFWGWGVIGHIRFPETAAAEQGFRSRTVKGDPGIFPWILLISDIFCGFSGKDQEGISLCKRMGFFSAQIPSFSASDEMDQIMRPYGRAEEMAGRAGFTSAVIEMNGAARFRPA